jgi:sulfate transport system substrate-binding protein
MQPKTARKFQLNYLPFNGRRTNWRLLIQHFFVYLILGSLALFVVWPWLPFGKKPKTPSIIIYGFSILDEVMNDAILPAFQSEWETKTGERIEFITSFACSGTITNQIILGVPADIAILSTELDAFRLVESGVLKDDSWRQLPYHGILNRTPFIILVRTGNPKNIHGFEDLSQPNVGIVHPDPLTSGGAQWAILAEYGSVLLTTGDGNQALNQLLGIWKNVVAQAPSARAAKTQFENGFGDVLITYEQEALRDKTSGNLTTEIIYPESTILSEHTVVIIDKNVDRDDRQVISALVQFLWSDKAQELFVEYGYRSVVEELNNANPNFGSIDMPFVVDDLGGWRQAKQEIIDSVWKERILKEINR